jgi:hypothetical protein
MAKVRYTDAVFDDTSGQWISRAEVAEIDLSCASSVGSGGEVWVD